VTTAVDDLADDTREFARDTSKDPILAGLEPILRGHVGLPFSDSEHTADSTVTTTAAVGSTNGTPPWVGNPVRHVGERVSECDEFVENLQRVQGRGRLTERAAHIGLECVPVPAIAAAIRRQGPQHRINRYVVLRGRHPVAIQQPG
jgi:hypothetical protein